MGKVFNIKLDKNGVGVLLKGHTRISTVVRGKNRDCAYLMSYESDLQQMLTSRQFWRSNRMMLDATSITPVNADYVFPEEGALVYFYADQFGATEPDEFLCIHTEIEEKGDGW